MTERDHPIDNLIRKLAGSPQPTDADRLHASEILRAEFNGETRPSRHRTRRRIVWVLTGSLVLAGLLFAVQIGRPTQAEATMEEIARKAAIIDPLTAPDGQFIHQSAEVTALTVIPAERMTGITNRQLVYQSVTTRQTWIGDNGTIQIRTTIHDPEFFNDHDRQAYYMAELDVEDQVGQTITTTVTETNPDIWPTDPTQLDAAIRAQMVTDRDLPETVEYLDVALDIIGESFASPELRAATLRLIGQLDGLKVQGDTNGISSFMLDYQDQGVSVQQSFTIDDQGYLRSERNMNISSDPQLILPPSAIVLDAEYSAPVVVGNLD